MPPIPHHTRRTLTLALLAADKAIGDKGEYADAMRRGDMEAARLAVKDPKSFAAAMKVFRRTCIAAGLNPMRVAAELNWSERN